MKRQFLGELRPGDKVDTTACVRSREMRLSRGGAPYLWMELGDRTGTLQAVRFDADPVAPLVPEGTVAEVRGSVTSWRGEPRIKVSALAPARSYTREDLMATSSRDIDELKVRFKRHVAGMRDHELRALVHRVFAAPGFATRFAECPGSADGHHAWLGGLLEHTVAVAGLVRTMASAYPHADTDLLLAAALLHDAGRVDELEFDTGIGVGPTGLLAGHVLLGLRRVDAAASPSYLPAARLEALRHAIAAHGATGDVRAATLEAMLLAHADRIDAEASVFVTVAGEALRSGRSRTGADNPLGRALVPGPVWAGPGRQSMSRAGRVKADGSGPRTYLPAAG